MYIDDGGITEAGTHEELLAKKGAYYKLYTAQMDEKGAWLIFLKKLYTWIKKQAPGRVRVARHKGLFLFARARKEINCYSVWARWDDSKESAFSESIDL